MAQFPGVNGQNRGSWRGRQAVEPQWWWLAAPCTVVLLLVLVVLAAVTDGPSRNSGAPVARSAVPQAPPGARGSGSPSAQGDLCATAANRYPSAPVAHGSMLVNPDEWNSTGPLCIRGKESGGFTVTSSGIASSNLVDRELGPGAYPNVSAPPDTAPLPIAVSDLRYATSSWSTTQKASGTYDSSFDLWYSPSPDSCSFTRSAELMVWTRGQGRTPSGDRSDSQLTVGGLPYQVNQTAKSGSHTLIIYSAVTPATSVTDLDLRAFTRDAVSRGYVPEASYLCAVQAGFEIWSGGAGLSSDSFSFQAAAGPPVGAITSAVPGVCLSRRDGAVLTAGCDGSAAQTWTAAPGGAFSQGGDCLTGTADAALSLSPCTGSDTQRWHTGTGNTLVNQADGDCLDEAGAPDPGLRPCTGGGTQGWYPPE